MTGPLARFEEGQLWVLDMGTYKPAERIQVLLMREHFLQRTRESGMEKPLSATYAKQCSDALEAWEKDNQPANSGQRETG